MTNNIIQIGHPYYSSAYLKNKVHKITVLEYKSDSLGEYSIAKTDCGRDFPIEGIGGMIDITLARLNHELCRKCFKNDEM